MSMVMASGAVYGSDSPLGSVGTAYLTGNVLTASILTFLMNLFLGTIAMMIIPSLLLPFWALLFGVYRALIWGIMLVVPIPGVMPLSVLLPHYLTLMLEGEAYVVAMFACTRGLIALLKPQSFGTPSRLKAYKKSIVDAGKILLVVTALLAVAAVYEAVEVTVSAGAASGVPMGGHFGFYDEEFGANSSYSNWTQEIRVNESGWTSFNLNSGKLTRVQACTNGTPIDVMVMDKNNFTMYNAGRAEWQAYVIKTNAVNETFDFVPPQDGMYWVVTKNTGDKTVKIYMQLRYKN
jgi:hypothetical protein